jgi:hypothetical protein
MDKKYISLSNKYSKKLLYFNNNLFNGGRSNYYKYMNAGYEYSTDGSYSTWNENDAAKFNKYILEYCGGEGRGESCTIYNPEDLEQSEYSKNANSELMRYIQKYIIPKVNKEDKEWLVNHWIYANNFYKVNIIIIILDDLYKNSNHKDEIASIAAQFLLYNSCGGLLYDELIKVAQNFNYLALSLRENEFLKPYIDKFIKSTDTRADSLCENENYTTNYGKRYNGGLNNHPILYNYYSNRYR